MHHSKTGRGQVEQRLDGGWMRRKWAEGWSGSLRGNSASDFLLIEETEKVKVKSLARYYPGGALQPLYHMQRPLSGPPRLISPYPLLVCHFPLCLSPRDYQRSGRDGKPYLQIKVDLGVAAHGHNPRTQGAEAGDHQCEASLCYILRPCLKN